MKLKSVSLVRWIFPFYFFLALMTGPLQASPARSAEEPVRAELFAEEESIQPGRPFWVGVELNMAEGWDTYWLNPGDSGFPTQVEWQLPEGFQASNLYWPYPKKFTNDSLVAFGYTDTVLLLSKITPPQNLPADQRIEIGAQVSWLACKDSCVPGGAHLSLPIDVSDASPTLRADKAQLFDQARKALPQLLEQGDLTVQAQKEEIVLNFKPKPGSFGEIEELLFIPEEGEVVNYAAPQNWQKSGEEITLNVKRAHPDNQIPAHVKGVLIVSEKEGGAKRAIQVDMDTASSPVAASNDGVSSIGMALGLAFLGGLILNVMPCVLPVIALKIFGFVKMAHQRRITIFKHGAVFSLGVLISFWLLSGVLLVLRAYGEGVGWGFQLQEPVFVAVLATILFLLGLSLFGLFEMGTSLISLGQKAKSTASSSPVGSSFMSGVLATLVATPCTGPLLGPALGFAMTLPPIKALTIFTSMGLGMAFPYLLFSAFPALVRYLPKPGNWMITFKQLMGFLMMATVVWLVWVFGAETDNMATFVLLGSFLVIAIGAWIFGQWATPSRSKLTRLLASGCAAILLVLGGGASIMTAKQHREMFISPSGGTRLVADHGWEVYSEERLETLRQQGVPVFIDFTAKWCLICQANKVTLHSSEVQKAFNEKGVVTMIADWTKKDPSITKELEKLGRSGVPVYALYPGDPTLLPHILPQTLTGKVVRDYLNRLTAPKTTVYAN